MVAVEPSGGRIIIDGLDVSTLGLYDLRSRLALVPQVRIEQGYPLFGLAGLRYMNGSMVWGGQAATGGGWVRCVGVGEVEEHGGGCGWKAWLAPEQERTSLDSKAGKSSMAVVGSTYPRHPAFWRQSCKATRLGS